MPVLEATESRPPAAEAPGFFLRLAPLAEAGKFAALLTAAERSQAARMANAALRTRFIVSRGLRRQMLAACTGLPAGQLEFIEDGKAKPKLAGADGWDFNLSHAGDHVAVAVRRGSVGIDLEHHREVRDKAGIVRRYFHPDEARAWQRLPEDRQAAGFFRLWSAREAAMKCAGLGLAQGISVTRVDPAILNKREATGRAGNAEMHLAVLDAPTGYSLVAALGQA